MRLTKRRLEIIIHALAYYETFIDDGEGTYWETEAERKRLEHDREQAFGWAHKQLAKKSNV